MSVCLCEFMRARAPVCKLFISGWSNFCTLVGHFSKLFKFASLNRLKTLIFVLKSRCSLKKRSSLEIDFRNSYFHPKIKAFSKKKKKKVFTWNRSMKFLFSSQNQGLHLESISEIPIFIPKSRCSLKKKNAAACDRQDLCKIVPRARSWTTLTYIMTIPQRPHRPHDQFATPYIDHFDPTWGRDPAFGNPWHILCDEIPKIDYWLY